MKKNEKIFTQNCEKLCERFGENIFFISQFREGISLFSNPSKEQDLRTLEEWAENSDLDKIDLLYVLGTGFGLPFLVFKQWLEEKKDRELVFLEEDPLRMGGFLATSLATDCLAHPRVHLFFYEKSRREEIFQEVAEKFPLNRIEVVALPSVKEKDLQEMKLKIFRKTTLSEALLYDRLFSHRHFANFFPNLDKIAGSSLVNQMKGRWRKIPAIVCGAGPSLNHSIPFLQQAQNKALIIAGGSAIGALSVKSILPHFGMAFDPNFEEYIRMKGASAFEVPFFYAMRLFHPSFSTLNGPLGYMRSAIGGLEELWMDEKLCLQRKTFIGEKLNEESLSVTTVALSLARYLGCDPIILCGVDLAYGQKERYAEGVLAEKKSVEEMEEKKTVADRIFVRKNQAGKKIYTSTKWIMEAKSISAYAKEFSTLRFYNASQGLPIEGIPSVSLQELLQKELTKNYDLSSHLHGQMQQSLFPQKSAQKISRLKSSLQKSFARCLTLSSQILAELEKMEKEGIEDRSSFETGHMILAEMDLKEEDAFLYFLSDLPVTIDRILERKYRDSWKNSLSPLSFARKKEKWELFHKAVQDYLNVFASQS